MRDDRRQADAYTSSWPPPASGGAGLFFALAVSNAAEAVEVLSAGFVLAQVTSDPDQRTAIAVAVFAGMLVGGLVAGQLADRKGRGATLYWAMLLSTCGMVAAALAPNLLVLVACRVCSGLGVGAATPALFALAVELAPVNRSGQLVTLVASFWMVGSLTAAGLAYMLLHDHPVDEPMGWSARWRRFAIACAALPMAATVLVCHHVKDADERPLLPAGVPDSPHVASPSTPPKFAHLARDLAARRAALLPLMLCWFGLNFGYYGLYTWMTVILGESGVRDEYAVTVLYAAAGLPGNLASILLIDRLGRRWLLVASMALCSASSLALAAVEFARPPTAAPNVSVVIVLALAFNGCATAGWNSLDALSAEAFDVGIRATAFGILTATGRVASVLAQFVNGALAAHVANLLSVTSGFMALGCVGALCLGHATRGQALEGCKCSWEQRPLLPARRSSSHTSPGWCP